jgi:hypothetical protein
MMDKKYILPPLLSILVVLAQPAAQAAIEAGEVGFTRGVLTGQVDNQPPRILGKGLPLHNGETLNTGASGFAIIKLKDGSRMTLRPNTTFKIEDVNTDEGKENAILGLLRGGFRAITGFISKRKPNAFKVNTAVATIGIRGTEFDARLCDGDECNQESKATGETARNESKVIGRIALLRGKASALDGGAKSRELSTGAAVYEQDELQTGIRSFAVVAFNDSSRVTMSPSTAFKVEEHNYKPEVPDENNSFLRFIRGGLRLITGAIGKLNRPSYRVGTPTATIGIRGTGFDLACEGDCGSNTALFNPNRDSLAARLMDYFLKPVFAQAGAGMYTQVWNGEIEIQYQGGKLLLQTGLTAYVKDAFSPPVIVPAMPAHLQNMGGAPRPDNVRINQDLFSGDSGGEADPGLYVSVRDGDVVVEGNDGSRVDLGRGEAAKVGLTGATQRLNFVPLFQKFDKTPRPEKVTPKMEKRVQLFREVLDEKEGFECQLQ